MYLNSLDKTDNAILDLLMIDARMSYSEIGSRVGLSRVAVKNRIATMERAGIIKGYKAIIDPQCAPETMTFVVNVETKPENFEECKRIFVDATETVTVAQTTGNCHLVLICLSPSVKAMKEFVNRMYRTVSGVTYISAHAVLDVVKGSILPDDDYKRSACNNEQS